MADEEEHTASRRIHIRLFQSPVEIADERHAKALRTERTASQRRRQRLGYGVITTWPVQAVSRGWLLPSPIPGLLSIGERAWCPTSRGRHRGRDDEGRVRGPLFPAYAPFKRGPVG